MTKKVGRREYLGYLFLSNAHTNFFTKFFTNGQCGEWLLVNKKVILMVGLDEN